MAKEAVCEGPGLPFAWAHSVSVENSYGTMLYCCVAVLHAVPQPSMGACRVLDLVGHRLMHPPQCSRARHLDTWFCLYFANQLPDCLYCRWR